MDHRVRPNCVRSAEIRAADAQSARVAVDRENECNAVDRKKKETVTALSTRCTPRAMAGQRQSACDLPSDSKRWLFFDGLRRADSLRFLAVRASRSSLVR